MSKLGLCMPLGIDETLSTYCSRLAALNGFESARLFAHVLNFSFDQLTMGVEGAIDRFASLVSVERELLEKAAIVPVGRTWRTAHGHSLSRSFLQTSRARFCPLCLRDDEVSGQGRRAFRGVFRMKWMVRFLRVCPIHQIELLTLPPQASNLSGDPYGQLLGGGRDWGTYADVVVSARSTAAEKNLLQRLEGSADATTWVDRLPLQPAFHFQEMLGAVERHGIDVQFNRLTVAEQILCADAGYQIVRNGEDTVRNFLTDLTMGYFRSKGKAGAYGVYGELATQMGTFHGSPGYDQIVDLMQATAIETLPIGPGDRFLGEVRRRKNHSISTACKESGIGWQLLHRLLSDDGIIPEWGYRSPPITKVVLPVAVISPFIERAIEWTQIRRSHQKCQTLKID
ncbi:Hypothetical protein NGAL_HAMBI2605_18280 [Neorhizobium galegae bv. orientalis]|nr:Hypothetical protein NGAL_HAMBI2605_18280 [Neorhizobium galegae bv. orientalis]